MSEWSDSTNRAPIVVAAGMLALILGVGIVGARGGDADSASTDTLPPASGSVVSESIVAQTVAPVASTDDTTPAVTLPAISRTLQQGAQGDDVQMVQQRLADLGFDPGPVDGIFGTLTTQAVWAFEKLVLGTPRTEVTGAVSAERWDRLRSDVNVSPRRSTNGQANHTEVYLPEQVLIVFHQDRPALISHMSSGEVDEYGEPREYCETATYDTDAQGRELDEPVTKQVCALSKTPGGVFTYDRQVEGKRVSPLGGMWNPVYFNYGIAVHGAENVPNEPASHGCVRLPMHISNYFQDLVSIGERILVWNGETEPEDVTERESLPSFDYADPDATTTTTSTTTTTVAPTSTAATLPSTTAVPQPATTAPQSSSTTTTTTTTVAAPPTDGP